MLSARVSNFLINGLSGIVVVVVMNMVLYNFGEFVDVLCVLVKNLDCLLDEFMALLSASDFFMGGVVTNKSGMKEIYEIGKGGVMFCGWVMIECVLVVCGLLDKDVVVISEIFY